MIWGAIGVATLALAVLAYAGWPNRRFLRWPQFLPPPIESFIVALVVIALVLIWYWNAKYTGVAFDIGFWTGFSASLLEDIVFFSIGGLTIFILQKVDFYRHRRLEDRIDYLFNAKILTSEERTYLKREIQSVSCDFIRDETLIDLIELDHKNKLMKLDVSRKFLIGKYVKENGALYKFDSRIVHDPMPDTRVAMEVFPISLQRFTRAASRKAASQAVGDAYIANGTPDPQSPRSERKNGDEPFSLEPPLLLEIAPNERVQIEVRWRGWQPFAAGTGVDDFFEIEFRQHWDEVAITLRNSLHQDVQVELEALGTVHPYMLRSGFGSEKEWSATDVKPGKKVLTRFINL